MKSNWGNGFFSNNSLFLYSNMNKNEYLLNLMKICLIPKQFLKISKLGIFYFEVGI